MAKVLQKHAKATGSGGIMRGRMVGKEIAWNEDQREGYYKHEDLITYDFLPSEYTLADVTESKSGAKKIGTYNGNLLVLTQSNEQALWEEVDEHVNTILLSIDGIGNVLDIKADLVGGLVPESQLPSYVSDVLEYANFAALPVTGETGKIYITLDDNKQWRWGGTVYVEISEGVQLGETSSTAYRGDRGKVAYDHGLVVTGNPHNVVTTQITDFTTAIDALGFVVGPASAVDTAIARFDGTTGKLVKATGNSIHDGNINLNESELNLVTKITGKAGVSDSLVIESGVGSGGVIIDILNGGDVKVLTDGTQGFSVIDNATSQSVFDVDTINTSVRNAFALTNLDGAVTAIESTTAGDNELTKTVNIITVVAPSNGMVSIPRPSDFSNEGIGAIMILTNKTATNVFVYPSPTATITGDPYVISLPGTSSKIFYATSVSNWEIISNG